MSLTDYALKSNPSFGLSWDEDLSVGHGGTPLKLHHLIVLKGLMNGVVVRVGLDGRAELPTSTCIYPRHHLPVMRHVELRINRLIIAHPFFTRRHGSSDLDVPAMRAANHLHMRHHHPNGKAINLMITVCTTDRQILDAPPWLASLRGGVRAGSFAFLNWSQFDALAHLLCVGGLRVIAGIRGGDQVTYEPGRLLQETPTAAFITPTSTRYVGDATLLTVGRLTRQPTNSYVRWMSSASFEFFEVNGASLEIAYQERLVFFPNISLSRYSQIKGLRDYQFPIRIGG